MSVDSWPARSYGGAIDVGDRSAILWPFFEVGIADTNEGIYCDYIGKFTHKYCFYCTYNISPMCQ